MPRTLETSPVRRWCRAGLAALERAREELDRTNVYPVPDGDTGTNLCRTMEFVVAAVDGASGDPGDDQGDARGAHGDARGAYGDGAVELRTAAHAALLGARGNSGVILSQLLRGVAESLAGHRGRCDGAALAEALTVAADLGYRAVGRPVEGTVLTVARAAASAASAASAAAAASADSVSRGPDIGTVARAAARGARDALARTTDQLEVLRLAGVVDAGGHGLVLLLDALAAVLAGDDTPLQDGRPRRPVTEQAETPADRHSPAYEVMYLLDAEDAAVDTLRVTLDGMGDSLVVVGGDGLWNVHVHADDAGAAVEAGMAAGRPHRVRVTYLADGTRRGPAVPRRVLCLAGGDGLASLLEDAGARVLRTAPGLLPTAAEILEAIRRSCAPEVVVLPDDAQRRDAVEDAAAQARSGGVRVAVLPTRATVQSLAALAVHDPRRGFDDDVVAMTAAAGATRFGELTVATREAVTSAGVCRPGDVLGLIEGDVAVIGSTVEQTARTVLERLLAGGGELVTLVRGADADSSLLDRLAAFVHASRPEVDTVVYDGGQPAYPLLVGVE